MGELRPQVLDALGLAGALRDEVKLFGRVTGIEAGFSSAMPARVSPETELVLWRTAGLILGALRRQAAGDHGPGPAGVHMSLGGQPGRAVCAWPSTAGAGRCSASAGPRSAWPGTTSGPPVARGPAGPARAAAWRSRCSGPRR